MFTVYAILSTKKEWIYVGFTDQLERRFDQHNKGQNKSTKPYAPFTIIHTEAYSTRPEARKREKYYKSAAGKRRLRKMISDGHGPV